MFGVVPPRVPPRASGVGDLSAPKETPSLYTVTPIPLKGHLLVPPKSRQHQKQSPRCKKDQP
jgi:hypothetical protein